MENNAQGDKTASARTRDTNVLEAVDFFMGSLSWEKPYHRIVPPVKK
jgi:hypothetical protein